MNITIYSYPEGISLNGKQYLLDENNDLLTFKTADTALNHLKSLGVAAETEEELEEDFGIYLEDES